MDRCSRLRKMITAITHAVQVGNSSIKGTSSKTNVGNSSQWNPISQLTSSIATTSVSWSPKAQPSGPNKNCPVSVMMATASARIILVRVNFGTRNRWRGFSNDFIGRDIESNRLAGTKRVS